MDIMLAVRQVKKLLRGFNSPDGGDDGRTGEEVEANPMPATHPADLILAPYRAFAQQKIL